MTFSLPHSGSGVQLTAISSSNPVMTTLFSYASALPDQAKRRYQQKMQLIGSLDPFLLLSTPNLASPARPADLPRVEASDTVAYLVLQTSFHQAILGL